MRTTNSLIRRVYAPLNVHCQLVCTTPMSPVTQIYNSIAGEYEPNREGTVATPTLVWPDVQASARDATWNDIQANSLLGDMKWTANGKDISTLKEWTGKYEIMTDGKQRGTLKIKRNIDPSTRITLHFSAKLYDKRTGTTINIESDDMLLTTTEQSDDGYGMDMTEDVKVEYDPVRDALALWQYKVAHNIAPTDADEYAAQKADAEGSAGSYLHKVSYKVYKGKSMVESGYTVKVFRVEGATQTELTAASVGGTVAPTELVALNDTSLTLDLRLVESAEYAVCVYVGGQQVARRQMKIRRRYPSFIAHAGQDADVNANDDHILQEAWIDGEGGTVECPESVYSIEWHTEATDGVLTTQKAWGEGRTCTIDMTQAGLGDTESDVMRVYCDVEQKPAHSVLADKSGAWLRDKDGNILAGH